MGFFHQSPYMPGKTGVSEGAPGDLAPEPQVAQDFSDTSLWNPVDFEFARYYNRTQLERETTPLRAGGVDGWDFKYIKDEACVDFDYHVGWESNRWIGALASWTDDYNHGRPRVSSRWPIGTEWVITVNATTTCYKPRLNPAIRSAGVDLNLDEANDQATSTLLYANTNKYVTPEKDQVFQFWFIMKLRLGELYSDIAEAQATYIRFTQRMDVAMRFLSYVWVNIQPIVASSYFPSTILAVGYTEPSEIWSCGPMCHKRCSCDLDVDWLYVVEADDTVDESWVVHG